MRKKRKCEKMIHSVSSQKPFYSMLTGKDKLCLARAYADEYFNNDWHTCKGRRAPDVINITLRPYNLYTCNPYNLYANT